MYRLYANNMPFYIRDFEHLQICYSQDSPVGTNLLQVLREDFPGNLQKTSPELHLAIGMPF